MQGASNILLEGNNLSRLFAGLGVSIQIALVSVLLSIPLGILVGVFMTSRSRVVRFILRFYLDFIRIMPQLVLLYIVFFGTAAWFGVSFDGYTSSIVVFTLWGAAEMGDLVRGALESIPRMQYDSAYVLGFDRLEFRRVLFRSTRMVKTTSLCMLIGVVELIRVGAQIIDLNRFAHPDGALWIYGAIFFMYFFVCFPLSLLSRYLEKRASK